MNYAEQLRNEMSKSNKLIIATKFAPHKEQIMNALAEGIKRIGYVCIDTSGYNTSSYEGRIAMCDAKREELPALAEFIRAEGFNVTQQWWGMSSNGFPDMLKITL